MVSTFDRAVTRIRYDLRERLLEESHENVVELLDALEVIADAVPHDIGTELQRRYELFPPTSPPSSAARPSAGASASR